MPSRINIVAHVYDALGSQVVPTDFQDLLLNMARHPGKDAVGNDIVELHLAEGQSHGFANAQPWCDLTLIAAHQFLKEQNLLTSTPPKLDTESQLKRVENAPKPQN